jgi:hypothetical protein
MYRRAFVATTVALPAIDRLGVETDLVHAAERTQFRVWRHFAITTKIVLQNSASQAQLWLPLAQTAAITPPIDQLAGLEAVERQLLANRGRVSTTFQHGKLSLTTDTVSAVRSSILPRYQG